jgi:predicted DNA-binding transcriptional regulator AlpA
MTTEERATRANDDIRLLSFGDVCDLLNVSAYTLNKWIRQGVFPQPIYMTPTSPRQFRYRESPTIWRSAVVHDRQNVSRAA